MTLDPRAHIVIVLASGALAAILERPILLLPFLVGALVSVMIEGTSWKRIGQGFLVGSLMIWASVSSQALFYADLPRTVLFDVVGFPVYIEGIRHGLWQSLRFLTLTLLGVHLCLRVSSGHLLHALNRMGLPQSLALMLAVAMRFVPIIWEDMKVVRRARSQRGRPMTSMKPLEWVDTERRLLVPVIVRAWQRAHILAESLDERGYDPKVKRESLTPLRFTGLDWLVVIGAVLLVAFTAAAHLMYQLYLWEIVYIPELRWLMRLTRRWL